MQLVTLAARPRPGVVLGDEIIDLTGSGEVVGAAGEVPGSVQGILEGGDAAIDLVRRIADRVGSAPRLAERLREQGTLVSRATATLLAPLPDPGLILSCGMNYRAHLREMNTAVPDHPTSFVKNSGAVIGPATAIVLPPSHPDMVDWEGEFSVVIGRPCHRAAERDALDYVAGYTLINDVSARDWVAPVFEAGAVMSGVLAWERNLLGKQFPTFCPMGPVVATKDEIPDPGAVELRTSLNGKTMQSADTDDLVFGVGELIAYYSQWYRFRPGDIITTGSPSGVGFGRDPKIFMRAGDRIEIHATGIGTLSNPVVAASR